MPVQPGLSATVELVVGDADTAIALHSGEVAVLATPRLLALCEEAAFTAVAPELSEGPHLSYAIQWFTFTGLTLVVYPLILRKKARDLEAEPA